MHGLWRHTSTWGYFWTNGFDTHLKKASHLKKAKELVYGLGKGVIIPTEAEILNHLRRSGSEGLTVGGRFLKNMSVNYE